MVDQHARKLDRQFDRLERELPGSFRRPVAWLRSPSSRFARIPLSLLLIVGGIFSFLPVLGLWMAPLGLLLLAQDVPVLRGPTRRMLLWLERRWVRWKRPRGERPGGALPP